MSSRKSQAESVVRCYEVGSPTRHQDGYTIYEVIQQIIQVDALERNVQESVVWKRYNDFKKLYKAMFSLHKALHRRDEFPPFVKAQLFNRFEDSVIEERRRTAQDLLNFVGQRVYLTNSVVFKQFFQNAQPVERTDECSTDILKPVLGLKPLLSDGGQHEVIVPKVMDAIPAAAAAADVDPAMSGTASPQDPSRAESPRSISGDASGESNGTVLSGIWLHRQQADDVSSADDDLACSEDDDLEASQEDTAPSGPESGRGLLAAADMAAFDTLLSVSSDLSTQTNVELLSMLAVDDVTSGSDRLHCDGPEGCVSGEPEQDLWSRDDVDGTLFEETGNNVGADSGTGSCSRSGSVIESGTGDLTMSPVQQTTRPVSSVCPVSLQQRTPAAQQKSRLPSLRPRKADSTSLSSSDETKYIVEAAELISQAQEHEIAENYPAAYSHYRSGIEILVKGVQKDSNIERQQAVSMKINKYLLKVDELYQTHLVATDGRQQVMWNRWGVECETEVDASIALLRSPSAALRNFRVIGVISTVLLVVDTATDGTFVIKVLYKSCRDLQQKSIVPTHLPYVVSLVRFYETDSAIYLQLQHAAGGRLWSYVGAYLNQCADMTANVYLDVDPPRPSTDETEDADRLSQALRLDHPAEVGAEELSESCAEAEEKSKLSSSDLESIDDSRDAASQHVSFSSVASPGFGEVLRSANPAMKCFSIDSSESEHASRHVSLSSADDGVCRVHSVAVASGVCQLCAAENEVTPRAAVSEPDGRTDERSIYDRSDSGTGDDHDTSVDDSCEHRLSPDDNSCDEESECGMDELRRASVRRRSSVEKSFGSSGQRRRRRTLSSAFGELDLAEGSVAGSTAVPQPTVHLPETCVKQWAAEIVVAISRLHSIGIVCRDLRPANLLLGDRGHILLTYFSQWNTVESRINDQAFDGLYCAPEVTGVYSVTPACDWWSLGALLYELLTGQSLQSCHPAGITSHSDVFIPDYLSAEATSLLRELLRYSPSERLGGGPGGSDEVRSHPFFSGIEWNNLLG